VAQIAEVVGCARTTLYRTLGDKTTGTD